MFLFYGCPHMEEPPRPGRLGPSHYLPQSCWDAPDDDQIPACDITGRECWACLMDEPWECELRTNTASLCPSCWEDGITNRLQECASGWLTCRENHFYKNENKCLHTWLHTQPPTILPIPPQRITVTITDSCYV